MHKCSTGGQRIDTPFPNAAAAQAAAAAAREAAMKTLRDQLHQQRVIAAQRHMAAWRIARAWQTYKHSSARDARHAQVTALQAVIRGAAARSTLRQLRQRQQVLAELQEALRKGQAAAVLAAQQRAAEAGKKGHLASARLASLILTEPLMTTDS